MKEEKNINPTVLLPPPPSRRTFLLTLAGGAASLLIGCLETDFGQLAARFISQDQLREFGLQTWNRIRSQFPISRNRGLQKRLQGIGERMVQAAGASSEKWEFEVFQSPQINAFVVPGGKVGFFEGMFGAVKNDAQIASVLGHEIGHLKAHHPEERLATAFAKQIGIAVVLAALRAGDVDYANEITALLGVGVEYGLIRPYSRSQEYEADHLGAVFMAKAGYPPAEAVSFWLNMMALSKGRPKPPQFLSTHPSDEKRITALRKALQGLG